MSASSPAIAASSGATTHAFWERLWRTSGVHSAVFFVIAYLVYGYQPGVGAATDTLLAFYQGGRTRILIAAVLSGMAVLNLMWFAAALRTTLADVAKEGWGAAATAASAAVGAMFLLMVTVGAALAYSTAHSGNEALVATLNGLAWSCLVLSSFPRAMLIMAGSFGLWRAGLISNALFGVGLTAVVLVLLGGTTWLSSGIWAPDGAYSRFISPAIGLVWLAGVSGILLPRTPGGRSGW